MFFVANVPEYMSSICIRFCITGTAPFELDLSCFFLHFLHLFVAVLYENSKQMVTKFILVVFL